MWWRYWMTRKTLHTKGVFSLYRSSTLETALTSFTENIAHH